MFNVWKYRILDTLCEQRAGLEASPHPIASTVSASDKAVGTTKQYLVAYGAAPASLRRRLTFALCRRAHLRGRLQRTISLRSRLRNKGSPPQPSVQVQQRLISLDLAPDIIVAEQILTCTQKVSKCVGLGWSVRHTSSRARCASSNCACNTRSCVCKSLPSSCATGTMPVLGFCPVIVHVSWC